MLLLLALLASVAPKLAATANITCPDGFEDLELEDDRCYYFSSDTSSWTPAFAECQELGGDLLSVVDPLHFYPISVIVQSSGQDAWCGLLNVGDLPSWADGTSYNPDLDQFIAKPTSGELYGYVSTDDGLFHFADSQTAMVYICYVDLSSPTTVVPTTPAPTACPGGWDKYSDGNCYLFSNDTQLWTTAEHMCNEEGANLVSIHDGSFLTFLLLSIGDDAYWTGLQNEDDKFVWADGTNTTDIDMLKPSMDEWEAGKNCVALSKEKYPTSLVHQDCFTALKYVCYKEALEDYDDSYYDYMTNE